MPCMPLQYLGATDTTHFMAMAILSFTLETAGLKDSLELA